MTGQNGKAAWLQENPDGSITIDFGDRAPKIDGTLVKSLVVREPTVGDQLAAQRGQADAAVAEVALLANLTEQTPEAIRGLTMRQYSRLQAALAVFLE